MPPSILERLRMLLIIASRASPLLRIISTYSFCIGLRSSYWRRAVMPMTAFIGVRISWLMLARNSDLAALACSACLAICSARLVAVSSCRLVFFRSSSVCLYLEMSRMDSIAPTTEPPLSYNGDAIPQRNTSFLPFSMGMKVSAIS